MQGASVSLGGNLVADAVLQKLEVLQRLNDHWFCEIECRSTLDRPIPGEEALGSVCKVEHLDAEGTPCVSFNGTVIEVSLTHQVEGWYTCRIRAASSSWLADRSPRNARFSGPLSNVTDQLGATCSLPDQKTPKEYVQFQETNWRFLLRLADDHGGWVRSGLLGLEVRNQFDPPTPLIFRDHYGLLEFYIDGELRPAKIAAAHYDSALNQSSVLPGESKQPQWEPQGSGMANAVQSGSSTQSLLGFSHRSRSWSNDDMQQRAQFDAERAQGGAVTAGGASRDVSLTAGASVELQNLGDANGVWNLLEVHHLWTAKEYGNTFRATPWKQWHQPAPPQRGIAPGVQVGRVVDNVDPEQRGRLVVSLFWQSDTLLLAPMLSLHTGAGFGLTMMPEVGDEVLVAFQDGDPERPMILGSLWSGKHQPPRDKFATEDESTDNLVKRLVTKSGIRIHLTDTPGKESISLATPASNNLMLSENVGETGRPAIAMHTSGDILFRAAGRIHHQALYASRHVDGKVPPPANVEFRRTYWDGTPINNLPYTITFADGTTETGRTDGSGFAQHSGVRDGMASVVYGENKNTPKSSCTIAVHDDFAEIADAASPSSAGSEQA